MKDQTKIWCEHIKTGKNGLTWQYSSGNYQFGYCIPEPEKQFVLWFWKFCPICGKKRPNVVAESE